MCIKARCMNAMKCMIKHKGSKCVKHTLNDQNMLNISKHGKPQNLVLIGVQTDEKIP